MQVLQPTTEYDEEKLERVYDQLDGTLQTAQGKENVIIF